MYLILNKVPTKLIWAISTSNFTDAEKACVHNQGWHKKILDLNQDLFDLFELM
jgi:hypothetical protein